MPVTYSDDPDGVDQPAEFGEIGKFEYRITYNAADYPGTLLQVINVLTSHGLEIRRMFVGSAELQAVQEYFSKRGIFKVSSTKSHDEVQLKNEIEDAIKIYYRRNFRKQAGDDHVEATVKRIDTTKRIHFSAQFVSVDKPGVVESVLAEVRETKVLGCDLGLISFILIPVYERFDADGPVSFLDIRGFVDNPYIYEMLAQGGLILASSHLTTTLHDRFRSGAQDHYRWSIRTTHPECEPVIGDNIRPQKIKYSHVAFNRNFRVTYDAPNVPGTAWQVAKALNARGYNIRRAFIGETNVSTYSPDDKPTSHGRFNVVSTTAEEEDFPVSPEQEKEALEAALSDAISNHFNRAFSSDDFPIKRPVIKATDAFYIDKYYFGVQIRISGVSRSNLLITGFMKELTVLLSDVNYTLMWREFFAEDKEFAKPAINVERLALLIDYTGQLHKTNSHESDTLIDLRISIKEHWQEKKEAFRNTFAENFSQWLWASIISIDDSIKFVGIKTISPPINEIYQGPTFPLS